VSGSDLAKISRPQFLPGVCRLGLVLCCLPLTSIRPSIYLALALHLSLADDSLLLPVASRGVAFDCETCRRAIELDGDVPGAYQTFLDAQHRQGLTLVHFSAQRKHLLWDTLAA